MDQAVAAVLELITYLLRMPIAFAGVTSTHDNSIAAQTSVKPNSIESSLQKLIERIVNDKLEGKLVTVEDSQQKSKQQPGNYKDSRRGRICNNMKCYNCQREGHFARSCPSAK